MEVQFGPNSVDEPNLLYKLQRKVKVFSTSDALGNRGYNLVTSSSKYGIVFIATPDGRLSVYYLKQLIDKESEDEHLNINLPEEPTHIAVSCDNEMLAVIGNQTLLVYKVTDFGNQNISPAISIKCDVNPSTFVTALQWNPCMPDTIGIAYYDGTLIVCQVSSSQIKKVQSKARCICWSPKGKQLVTGNNDGTLSQYKPDLTPAKMIAPPNLFEGSPTEALAIYWISTFQFAVVYKNAMDNSRPAVTIVNTPKGGQPSCLNYEDICYSMGSNRPWYYYLQGIAQWNIILSSSSNSMEIATLGSTDGANWFQWCQSDEARPELPLTDKKIENYPVGLCIDTCAIHQLPWGENETLPFMPLVLVVSQSGLLTIFNVINLKKDAPQLCSPPQQLTLPANALVSEIPGHAQPQQPPASKPAVSVPQPKVQPQPTSQPQAQPQPKAQQPQATFGSQATFGAQPAFGAQSALGNQPNAAATKPTKFLAQPSQQQTHQKPAFSPATWSTAPEKQDFKAILNVPQVQSAQSQAQDQPPKPTTPAQPAVPKAAPTSQAKEINAALKAEQEKANKLKADDELRKMLLNEVNDFRMEIYNFLVKSREMQIKLQRDLEAIDANFSFQSLDAEQLKKDCSMEELRGAIIELKLELVRACAVVAEARTHAEAKELYQWSQADPLTTKRVASVKKLAYYVQTQLEQAHKALDYRWNEMAARELKPGQRMIRPVLEDVYQPLVKQQEILSRQQAVLRTLKNTLKECDTTPMFKSTSLLRSTPFRNKDPLSKLTKNILNMSIEPQSKTNESGLSAQKLDALRDLLSNHKPAKIKPVAVELRHHLTTMRKNYEKSLKEKLPIKQEQKTENARQDITIQNTQSSYSFPQSQPAMQSFQDQTQTIVQSQQAPSQPMQPQMPFKSQPVFQVNLFQSQQPAVSSAQMPKAQPPIKTESVKPDLISKQMPISAPSSFTPVSNVKPSIPGLANVARTLFTDDEKPEQLKSPQPQAFQSPPAKQSQPQTFEFSHPTMNVTANTRSVLKDMLQNKQEAKNDANIFMGQKICSPTVFSTPTPANETQVFASSKPLSGINNMFSKFTTSQPFGTEPKVQIATGKPKLSETGEPENEKVQVKKEEKPLTNLFGLKTSTPFSSSSQNVPDVLKTNTAVAKSDKPKVESKVDDKSSENKKAPENVEKPVTGDKKPALKPFSLANSNMSKPTVLASAAASITPAGDTAVALEKLADAKTEDKTTDSKTTSEAPVSSACSIFEGANSSPLSTPRSPLFGTPSSSSVPTSPILPTPTSQPQAVTIQDSQEPVKSTASSVIPLENTTSPLTTKESTSSSALAPTTTSDELSKAQTSTSPVATSTPATTVFSTPTTQSSSSSDSKHAVLSTSQLDTSADASKSVFASLPSTGTTIPTTVSVFGSSTASVFASSTPASGLFSATTTSAASIFGSAATAQSGFGSATTTSQSIFGSTTTAKSVFGSATTTTPAASTFGAANQTSVFGSPTTTTQSSVFGSSTTSIFSSTPATKASVFGSPSTQASVFGQAATTQASVFGQSQSSPASVFGQPQTTQASVFGQPQTTQASIFGQPQTTQASVFGQAQSSPASVFGSPTTTTQSGSIFGNTDNLFASASISTTSASPSGGNIFGGSSSGSVFGGGSASSTNIFGSKGTFGQSNTSAASIFGGGGASSFGQKPATNFWGSGGSSTGSAFGSSGFGGNQATTQASSIFGCGAGGSFSQPSSGQHFGSPQQPSVFGSPQQQSASPSFGGSPVFGSKPVFGQSPGFGSGFGGLNKSPSSGFGAPATFGGGAAFGGGATFGGSATFGGTSPSKMFGGATAAAPPSFGSPTQSNPTFENLATQNTLTFGNLAQQSGQQPAPAPAFNTSPSFTGWRG